MSSRLPASHSHMTHQTDFFKESLFYYRKSFRGRSTSHTGARVESLHQRESGVLVAPAPGTAELNTMMNEQPAMNDDSTIVIDSAVPPAERDWASEQRPTRRKSDEMNMERYKIRRSIALSQEDEELWIDRDQNDNIRINNLSKETFFGIISKQMHNNFCNNLPIDLVFSENQIMSSKISGFIGYFNIDKNKCPGQYCFAVIEPTVGSPKLIKHFIPVNLSDKNHLPDIDHSEEQCIREIKKEIKGKEQMIKAIYIFTKLFPCVDRKDRDSCMIQLVNFSEEMIYHFKIKLYVAFQDFYTIGNIVTELKFLINDEDLMIKHHFRWLKETVNEQYHRSTFTCFHRNKNHKIHTSRTIKNHIKTQTLDTKLLNWKDVSFILKCIIEFPNNEMTLDEYKNYGKQQADKLKTHVKKRNVSEETTEKVCLLFYSKWCDLVREEYEEFIYEKLSDYINSFADKFIFDQIKAIANDFNLERVVT